MYRLYLSTFERRSWPTQELAERLERHFQEFGLPIEGAVGMGVFAPRTAVNRIAGRMMGEANPFEFLKQAGIEAPHGDGLMAGVHREFVNRHTRAEIRRPNAASERLLNWLAPPGASPMEAGAEFGIDALLLPWTETDPDEHLRRRLRDVLVQRFGDPRLRETGVWPRCSREALAVLRRWLAQVTIEVFFEIISAVVTSHMWENRKGLWLNRIERGEITDAWFALSRRGAEEAERLQRRGGVELAYAENESWSSSDREKCLLLMKINGRTVVEGSHSFKTHIYRRGDTRSVPFFRPSYTCEQFRADAKALRAKAIVHHQSWPYRVRNALDG